MYIHVELDSSLIAIIFSQFYLPITEQFKFRMNVEALLTKVYPNIRELQTGDSPTHTLKCLIKDTPYRECSYLSAAGVVSKFYVLLTEKCHSFGVIKDNMMYSNTNLTRSKAFHVEYL